MSGQSNFSIGDKVVYPSHGVGQIINEEIQSIAGTEVKMYVIDFMKDKMKLRVPVGRAGASGLRVLSNDNEMEKAVVILKGKSKPGRGMWSRRAQEYENKINSGNILSVAEVVRDLHKNVEDPERSYSERVIYESALSRLAGEFAAVNDVGMEEATNSIISILKSKKVSTKSISKPANEDNEESEEEAA